MCRADQIEGKLVRKAVKKEVGAGKESEVKGLVKLKQKIAADGGKTKETEVMDGSYVRCETDYCNYQPFLFHLPYHS